MGTAPDGQRSLAVERLAERIDDPAEPRLGRPDHRIRTRQLGLAAETDAVDRPEGHEKGPSLPKADHLADHAPAVARHQIATRADRKDTLQAGHLDKQAQDPGDAPIEAILGELVQLLDQTAKRSSQL